MGKLRVTSQMKNPTISVVVPVYNSAGILSELVRRIDKSLCSAGHLFEIILVDDCSTDNSWEKIQGLTVGNTSIRGLSLRRNVGQWHATLIGLSMARGNYLVTIDDDLEYCPEDINRLYAVLLDSKYKVVFGMAGDKYIKQGKNNVLSSFRKGMLNFLWGTAASDSFKVLPRSVLFEGNVFLPRTLLDAFLSKQVHVDMWGYVPVGFNERFSGQSNYFLFKKVKLFFKYSTHYGVRPLVLLGLVMCPLFLLSLFVGGYGVFVAISLFVTFSAFLLYYLKSVYVDLPRIKLSELVAYYSNF